MLTVGDIGLDLVVNQDSFNRQMSGIESLASKAGKTLVAAFAVDKIVNFGKSCIELGSNLAEVQNVVDVTFSSMSEKVNEFSKTTMTQFGLSETVAKKYTGTFGAMAKAFGFTEQEAYNMSTTLTGLAGDGASFYNISTDEAYTKLKSVFTGETETLKDLGVVMTQAALDQYALANGYGKTTSAMSEQEKTALRYNFVLQQLTLANGDFARTSNSWANQVRVLSLQFDSLKATLGQGLINIFLPVVKVLNVVIQKLQIAAGWFKTFTEMVFGKADTTQVSAPIVNASSATDNLSNSLSNVGNSASNASKTASKSNDNIAKSAKKATKEIKGILGGLDEINNLNINETAGTNPTSSTSPSTGGLGDLGDLGDLGSSVLSDINSDLSETNTQVSELQKKLERMKNLFLKGFNKVFKNNFKQIQKHCKNIKKSLKDIFEDSKVKNSIENFSDSFIYNLGRLTGSVADIGATIAENLFGGLDKYLEENKDRLKDHIIRLFDIGEEISNICGDFGDAIANIFRVFRSDEAKAMTGNIIGIFTEAKLGVLEVFGTVGKDLLDIITSPIIENQDKIKEVLKGLFSPINTILEGIKDNIEHAFDKFWEVYEKYIKPGVDNIIDGLNMLLDFVLDVFLKDIIPGLEGLSDAWSETFGPATQKLLDNLLEGVGQCFYGITELFKGVIETITGICEGDWSKVWQGLVDAAKGIWDSLAGVLKIFGIDLPSSDEVVSTIKSWWNKVTGTLGNIILNVGTKIESIYEKIKDSFNSARDYLADKKLEAQSKVESIYEKAKETFNNAKNYLSDRRLEARTKIESIYEKIKSSYGSAKKYLADRRLEAKTKIESVYSKIKSSYESAKSYLKSKKLQVKINVTSVVGSVKNIVNKIIDSINKNVISKLKVGGFSVPKIPRLASGGYVKANTPQLAMIGDNKRYGEIVAPENKMNEMVNNALQGYSNMLQNGSGDTYTGDIIINLDGNTIFREKIIDVLRQLKRQGVMV